MAGYYRKEFQKKSIELGTEEKGIVLSKKDRR